MTTPNPADREALLDRFRKRCDRLRAAALADHDPDAPVFDPLTIDPPEYFSTEFPESVAEQCERRWGGVGSAIVVDRRAAIPHETRVSPGGSRSSGSRVPSGRPRVLAVERGFAPGWEAPGGDHEPGETLAETARRETREETNIEVKLTGVLYARDLRIDYGPPAPVPIPVVVFTAERVGGRRAVPTHRVSSGEPEIVDARWVGPDELPEDLRDRERIREYLLAIG